MSLQEVKDDILQDAEEEADRIVEEAEEKKKEIIEEAEQEADEIREKHEEELEEEKASLRKQEISNARMKAKQEKMQVREEFLEKSFDSFRERLENLDEDEKESFVESCLEKVGFEVGKVIGSEEFEDAVSEDFEEGEVDGIVVVSEDETRRQSFTFDKIVENLRESYRKEVADKLFE